MSTFTYTTYVPFPPVKAVVPINDLTYPAASNAGSITHIHCDGPIDADIYDAAGNLLGSYKADTVTAKGPQDGNGINTSDTLGSPLNGGVIPIGRTSPYDVDVSLSFSGGAPYVVQRSASAIVLTLDNLHGI